MIAISLTFPAGRYHATPWGRHVNEGAVEWPPSPWRILRALIATWKRTLPDLTQDQVEPILRVLAKSTPEFFLPPASTGHTRHFMPWFKKGPGDRTLVFDAFVVVTRNAQLIVRWPLAPIDGIHRDALKRILTNLNTLGRAESWCVATLLPDGDREIPNAHLKACPLEASEHLANHEIVRLLCPDPETAFESDLFVDRTKKKPKRIAPPYDPDWHVCAETLWLHQQRWSDPPGSRWVPYTRPRDCFKIEPGGQRRTFSTAAPRPQVVRFALDSAVLPLVTETLPVAEGARRALMSWHGRLTERSGVRGRSSVLSGKDEDGQPLRGHVHAYYLPTAEGAADRDRLTHLTLVASDGFGPEEMRAISRLRMIRPRGRDNDSYPLRVLLLGYGRLDEYEPSLLRPSRMWISATPYIATRHAKTRGRQRIDVRDWHARETFLLNDLRAQLAVVRRDLTGGVTDQVSITSVATNGRFQIGERWRPIQFKRFRAKGADDGGNRLAGAFRLEFPSQVRGLVALGYGSHFGMGLFVPVAEGDA